MTTKSAVEIARTQLLSEFRWHGGHADVWRMFVNAKVLSSLVDGLAEHWRDTGITHVLGIESRGFLLGGAVAVSLGAGFQAVRKEGGMLPGTKVSMQSAPDYRSRSHLLRMQAFAARELVDMCGSHFAGVSILMDELEDEVRVKLGRVTSLVRASELGDPDA